MTSKTLLTAVLVVAVALPGCDRLPEPSATPAATVETLDPPATTAAESLTPERFHAAIKARNPDYRGEGQFQFLDDTHIAVVLARENVSDLSPLAELPAPIAVLKLPETPVRSLGPLKGMPLMSLDLFRTEVSDLTALRGMPLVELFLDETGVTDLQPLEGMALRGLRLNGTGVTSLAPLRGMPLIELNLFGTGVRDLSALHGAPLRMLWLNETPVTDLSPLEGAALLSLTLHRTRVSDLGPLANSMLQRLHIAETPVTDLTPIGNLPLTRLIFTPGKIEKGLDGIRDIATLRELDVEFPSESRRTWSPDEFWKRHDAGEFK